MSVFAVGRRFRRVVRFHGARAGVHMLALAAARKAVDLERVTFYELARRPECEARDRETRWATAAEIVEMSADPVWDMRLDANEVNRLFAAGHRCVLNVVAGRIAGYAWMNPNRIVVPKLRLAMPVDERRAHIYKGLTHPDFRGQRICVDRFAHWYAHLTEPRGVTMIVDFSFDNYATLARAARCGLRPIGHGTYVGRGPAERCWVTGPLARLDREVIPRDLAHCDH